MRTITRCAPALLLLLTGFSCSKSVSAGSSGRKLSLTKPSNQTVHRGETEQVAVSIGRENFNGPVHVRFTRLPHGVEVVDDKDIAQDQTRAVYTLHASPEADIVDNSEAMVVAEGPEGLSTTQTFLISVKDKK